MQQEPWSHRVEDQMFSKKLKFDWVSTERSALGYCQLPPPPKTPLPLLRQMEKDLFRGLEKPLLFIKSSTRPEVTKHSETLLMPLKAVGRNPGPGAEELNKRRKDTKNFKVVKPTISYMWCCHGWAFAYYLQIGVVEQQVHSMQTETWVFALYVGWMAWVSR